MNILVDGQTLETPEIQRGIGIYFKNVLGAMMKQSYEHQWYLTLSDKRYLNHIEPWVAERIDIILDKRFMPGSDFQKTEDYSHALNEAIGKKEIDLLWIPNPMMVNVLFPNKITCPMVVTMYDLIPLVMPIKSWSEELKTEYGRRLEFLLENKAHLLCISEATKSDFIEHVGELPDMNVTLLAADTKRFFRLREKSGLSLHPNIVFTGGFDYRKNIDGAIKILKHTRTKYGGSILNDIILYIICKCDEDTKSKFNQKLIELGLEKNVILTGYVPDEELASYYCNADVFFFPSLYEGFGLPILEAMLGGAYVLSSDNSSLPEVCGNYAILGDVTNLDEMSDKLYRAIQNAATESLEDKHERQRYAYSYSWEETGLKTLNIFERIGRKESLSIDRQKIAIVTPWPEQKTGIAGYVYRLVPYLYKYYDIDIYTDKKCDCKKLKENPCGNVYGFEQLFSNKMQYVQIIYQIGNNSDFHTGIYELMLKCPGIAEIHDYILQPFFYYADRTDGNKEKFRKALEEGYGIDGIRYFEELMTHTVSRDADMNLRDFPMTHTVCGHAKATIFHNHWSKKQMCSYKNVFTIPLASFEKEPITREIRQKVKNEFIQKNKIKDEIIVGCFGFINANKRPENVLRAIGRLLEKGLKLKLIYFGECNVDKIRSLVQKMHLENEVIITGYLDKIMYEVGLEMTDLVVNLRYPSMGEASATLCEVFQYGKPVLVSQTNQYLEYPDEVCWKVPIGIYEIPVLEAMIGYLAEHEDVRKALGYNAQMYASQVLNPEKIANSYYKVLSGLDEREEE